MGKIIKLFLNNFVVKGFVDNKSLSIFALAKSETQPWKCGWVAETTSLLNWRTGNRTGGSNPPASAKSDKRPQKGLFFYARKSRLFPFIVYLCFFSRDIYVKTLRLSHLEQYFRNFVCVCNEIKRNTYIIFHILLGSCTCRKQYILFQCQYGERIVSVIRYKYLSGWAWEYMVWDTWRSKQI